MNEISFSGGTLTDHVLRQKENLPAGTWPVIAEETCSVYSRDLFTGLDFLHGNGLYYGGIKGNSFARNHLWLEIILYNLQIIFFYWQSFLSLPDFSGNESYAWSLRPRDISHNFELAEGGG